MVVDYFANDARITPWTADGGAMGLADGFNGGVSDWDGLGKRKRRKKRGTPRALAAPRASMALRPTGSKIASGLVNVRRKRRTVTAAVMAPPVSMLSALRSGPAFNAAAADSFGRAFSAAVDQAAAADMAPVPGVSSDEPLYVGASDDLTADDTDAVDAASEGSPNEPLDVESLEGIGKFFKKAGKVLGSVAQVAAPVAAGFVGGPLAATAVGAISSGAGGKGKGVKVTGGKPVSTGSNFWGDIGQQFVRQVGNLLLDSAGNVVAKASGGQWIPASQLPTVPPAPAPAQSSNSIPWPWIVGGVVLAVVLSRR